MGCHEGLADDVAALEADEAFLELASCDEFPGQGNLAIERGSLNGIHELISVAT
jgi:hypothetical protein